MDDDDDDLPPDEVRPAEEIARRALALFGVWRLAIGSPRDEVLGWLDDHNLGESLSPNELAFIGNKHPRPQQKINFGWHSERLIVLLWALNVVENLPGADEQCDPSVFQRCLPPFSDESVEQLISCAVRRDEDELREEAERTLDLHWHARDARLNKRTPRVRVDIEIVQERHHAINWVTGYCGLDWDEVTRDT